MSETVNTPDGKTRPIDPWPKQLFAFTEGGEPVPLRAGDDGRLLVSATGGGGGGGGDASAMNQIAQITAAEATNTHLSLITGSPGSEFIADTAPHAGAYGALVALTDVEIGSITLASGSSGAAALAGLTLSAGQAIMVSFTSVTLTTGVAQLVKLPS